jgi:hypothetical protein
LPTGAIGELFALSIFQSFDNCLQFVVNGITNPDKEKTVTAQIHETISNEIDFTGGTRAKFYRKNAQLQLPIHPEASVQKNLAALDNAKYVDLSDELLGQ